MGGSGIVRLDANGIHAAELGKAGPRVGRPGYGWVAHVDFGAW